MRSLVNWAVLLVTTATSRQQLQPRVSDSSRSPDVKSWAGPLQADLDGKLHSVFDFGNFLSMPTSIWNKHPPSILKRCSPTGNFYSHSIFSQQMSIFKIIDICFCLCSVNHCCSAGCCNNILSPLRSICLVEIAAQIRGSIHSSVHTSWGVSRVRFRLFTVLVAARPRTQPASWSRMAARCCDRIRRKITFG